MFITTGFTHTRPPKTTFIFSKSFPFGLKFYKFFTFLGIIREFISNFIYKLLHFRFRLISINYSTLTYFIRSYSSFITIR